MSAESDFLDYFEALARRLTPAIFVAYLQAVRDLTRAIAIDTIARLIETAGAEAAADAILSDQLAQEAFHSLQVSLRQVVDRSGTAFVRDIPAGPSAGTGTVRVMFRSLDPNVVRAIERYETEVIGGLTDAMRESVRDAVRAGLQDGIGPREIARGLKDVLGLAPNQAEYVRNYEAELRALGNARTAGQWRAALARGDTPAVLARVNSDGNFDRTVAKAIRDGRALTEAEIKKGVERYRKNWERTQAETVSRTVTLNAMREAQHLAWDQAIASGKVTEADLVVTWITTLDGRERATHHEMHGAQRGYRDVWFVPGAGPQRYPGETEYNCRCREWISPRIRRASDRRPRSLPPAA